MPHFVFVNSATVFYGLEVLLVNSREYVTFVKQKLQSQPVLRIKHFESESRAERKEME